MTTLITFATIEEAHPTIDLLAAKPLKSAPWLYEWGNGLLIITGIGSFAAFVALSSLPHDIAEIYNFGLAGALNDNLALGTIHEISRCSKLLWHPQGIESVKVSAAFDGCPELILKPIEEKSLISSDFPIHDRKLSDIDLVDMEGYGVAFFATRQKKPCRLYKVVSDYCDASSSSLIKEGLKRHAETIAQFIDRSLVLIK